LGRLGSAEALWSTIKTALETDAGERLDWTNWVLFDEENAGKATWIDTDSYLWDVFVLLALRELNGNTKVLHLTPSEVGWAASHSADGRLWQALKQVVEDTSGKFVALIDKPGADVVSRLKNAITESAATQEQREIDSLIDKPLDQGRIEQVSREIVDAWTEAAALRQIVASAGAYVIEEKSPPDGVRNVGYFQLDRKDVYVSDSHLVSDGWGDHYGRGLAQAENEIVINDIVSQAVVAPPQEGTVGAEWPGTLRKALAAFKVRYQEPIVVLAGVQLAAWTLSRDEGFVRHSGGDSKHLLGRFDGVKVYEIHADVPATALIIDFRRFGRWHQFVPKAMLETEVQIAPGILFGVAPVTLATADAILEKDPGAIETHGGGDKTKALRDLQQSVQFRLVESFEFSVQDPEAGVKFVIEER